MSPSKDDVQLTITVTITNTGLEIGSEVAQVYIEYPDIGLTTPRLQLKGFKKARDVVPGQAMQLEVSIDKYGMAYWDVERRGWTIAAGKYHVYVGGNSEELPLKGDFKLKKELTWNGL